MLKYKTPYQDIGAKAYEQQVKDRELAHLRKKAAQLSYALTVTMTKAAVTTRCLEPGSRQVFDVIGY